MRGRRWCFAVPWMCVWAWASGRPDGIYIPMLGTVSQYSTYIPLSVSHPVHSGHFNTLRYTSTHTHIHINPNTFDPCTRNPSDILPFMNWEVSHVSVQLYTAYISLCVLSYLYTSEILRVVKCTSSTVDIMKYKFSSDLGAILLLRFFHTSPVLCHVFPFFQWDWMI